MSVPDVILWLPLAVGLLCFLCRRGARLVASPPRRAGRSAWRSGSSATSTPAAGLQHVVSESLDPRPRRPLRARRRRAQPLPRPADRGALDRGDRSIRRSRDPDRAAHLLLHARPRPDRDARRLPRPGPAALRPLLRPDADPVLLPDRRLGHGEHRIAGDDQDDRLHARRLAADARRRRSRPRCSRPTRPASSRSRSPTLRAEHRLRTAARTGSSGSSRSPSWSRCRPSSSTAGCPTPTASRPLPVLALLSGVLSKVAAYGFLRVVLPLYPDATIQFQEIVMIIALGLDPLRLGRWRSRRPTSG